MKWAQDGKGKQKPIFSWCEYVEDGAMKQAVDLSIHPSIFHHVALMPDCHQGYGMPIGGVIACERDIIPNAVGVDIGCGMCAVRTTFPADDLDEDLIKKVLGLLRKDIPVGFKHREYPLIWDGFDSAPDLKVIQEQISRARRQLGTLGGGNHFLEMQVDEAGFLWLMLHSGSRNFGYRIAKHYHELAQELCEKYHTDIPVKDLAFLPTESEEGQEYITAMRFALEFAAQNRKAMMGIFSETVDLILGCEFNKSINIHHNYADIENHFGRNVWVHRKGATLARKGTEGIIPGSMGTSSYIVEGLGNPDSFHSCSHGAGRCMSRSAASHNLTVEECDKAMEGIVYGRWGKGRKGKVDLGEAPQAYKNIHEVIVAQADLVKVAHVLQPLGVVKG